MWPAASTVQLGMRMQPVHSSAKGALRQQCNPESLYTCASDQGRSDWPFVAAVRRPRLWHPPREQPGAHRREAPHHHEASAGARREDGVSSKGCARL
jgi:hypothetical protein